MKLLIICYIGAALGFFIEEARRHQPEMTRAGVKSKFREELDPWPVFILAELFVCLLWPVFTALTAVLIIQDFFERREK